MGLVTNNQEHARCQTTKQISQMSKSMATNTKLAPLKIVATLVESTHLKMSQLSAHRKVDSLAKKI